MALLTMVALLSQTPEHLVSLERSLISLSNALSFGRIVHLLDEHHI